VFCKNTNFVPYRRCPSVFKNADGTVLGEGIGIIILKRLADAQKDKDRIYAVIKGIGSSSDGKSQSIYAPRAEGQIKALQAAYEQADIDPATVELVEAHGTGTRVGDRVEFQALSKVFENTSKNSCALGSVKSNIGHTKASAGAAGIIKAALSLHHKVLPPTLKADTPDPDLNIQESPFYLNTQSRPWLKNPNIRAEPVSVHSDLAEAIFTWFWKNMMIPKHYHHGTGRSIFFHCHLPVVKALKKSCLN
jgi:acyl transferase domain-containing protein